MKKIVILIALVLFASNANAWDLASVANKVKTAADETSAKIESVQNKSDEKSQTEHLIRHGFAVPPSPRGEGYFNTL